MKLSSLICALALGAARIASAEGPSPEVAKELAAAASALASGQPAVSPMFASRDRDGASFMVALNAGTCYTCVAAGGAGVTDVDLLLFDPAQKKVAADRRADRRAQFAYCAPSTASYRIQVAAKSGDGEVAFQLFQAVAGSEPVAPPETHAPPPRHGVPPPEVVAPPPLPPPPPPTVRSSDPLTAELMTMAQGLKIRKKVVSGVLPADVALQLDRGQCYSVVTVRASMAKKMAVTLMSPMGKKVAFEKSAGTAARVVHCPSESGPYRLQIRADKGGEFRVGVFTQ